MARSKFSFILQVVAALVLSAIPILHYPFGWFQTLFHGLSHGLSAILTGGSIW
ncbi:MAG: M50 family metallopeptidase [Candidatus Thiodiazotropha sp. (ex Lucinoma kastoroae)]|nr:M50 family metallopeptidase [Candidatus Thiodiazotropha sp. (ex Lucinoma kastoroae)]MCU7860899.1 M50 family metallopeptidase [Candidatus Thiodiazotropha sp. (ex Lucinoma kastoroae)]